MRAGWVRHPKGPMSDATRQRSDLLAERFRTPTFPWQGPLAVIA